MKPVEHLYDDLLQAAANLLKKAGNNLSYDPNARQIKIHHVPKEFAIQFSGALQIIEGSASGSTVGWRSNGDDQSCDILLPVEPHKLSSQQMKPILDRLHSFGLCQNQLSRT